MPASVSRETCSTSARNRSAKPCTSSSGEKGRDGSAAYDAADGGGKLDEAPGELAPVKIRYRGDPPPSRGEKSSSPEESPEAISSSSAKRRAGAWPSEGICGRSVLDGRTSLGRPSDDNRSALIRDWDRRSLRGLDTDTPLSWVKSLSELEEVCRTTGWADTGVVAVDSIVTKLRVE